MRVPLGGRKVRGYVVEVAERDAAGLKEIAGVSGDLPVFGARLRDALVWGAHHYVAPVSVALERAAPPNLPTRLREGNTEGPRVPTRQHVLGQYLEASASGRRQPPAALITTWEDVSWLEAAASLTDEGSSILVVVATAAEVEFLSQKARQLVGERALAVTGEMDDRQVTDVWSRAATSPGVLLVGTPRVATWPVASLRLVMVLEEGRRAMKDRQTPTFAVRRLTMTRARLEGFGQVYVGPTPSLDLLAAGPVTYQAGSRAWPLVEVVDRNEEPPGGGLLTERARAAISGMTRRKGRVFVFTHRRGYAPAYRCSTCRELRRCATCGSRPEPGENCPRCGAANQPCLNCGGSRFEPLGAGVGRVLHELRNLMGDRVGEAATDRPVLVGSERDLAALPGVDLAVAVDVDGLALGTNYRASEEALRILARLAGRVRRGTGHRLLVQTSMPDQPLVTALRRGEPSEFLRAEMEQRRQMGYPPVQELMVVEVRGESPATAEADLAALADEGVAVMGPARRGEGLRWLVQGQTLGGFKLELRPLVQRWRDAGATVRIDVDPLDL